MRVMLFLVGLSLVVACGSQVDTSITSGSGGGTTTASSTGSSSSNGNNCSSCTTEQICVHCSDDVGDSWDYCALAPREPDPNGPPTFSCGGYDNCEVGVEYCVEHSSPYVGCYPNTDSACVTFEPDCEGCDCVDHASCSCSDDADGNIHVRCYN